MDLAPKVRASYFVNVRGQGEMALKSPSVPGLMSQSSTIAGMTAANSRPFEEIKRMRLSQALDCGGGQQQQQQQQQQDAFGMLRLTPSPTYSTSAGRAPHFDAARLAQRFSPGKGVKVSGFPSSLGGRPAAFGGAGAVTFGPLSPALTEPPTPPSHWKLQEPEAFATNAGGDGADGGGQRVQAQQATAGASQQGGGVLPMEQRPIDEVSAVQALMSVGLGKGGSTSLMSVDEETADCPEASPAPAAAAAIAAVVTVPRQQADAPGGGFSAAAFNAAVDIGASKVRIAVLCILNTLLSSYPPVRLGIAKFREMLATESGLCRVCPPCLCGGCRLVEMLPSSFHLKTRTCLASPFGRPRVALYHLWNASSLSRAEAKMMTTASTRIYGLWWRRAACAPPPTASIGMR